MKDKRYKTVCPYCKKDIYVTKSIAMEMGYDFGRGICCHCKNSMTLKYNGTNETMEAKTILESMDFSQFSLPMAVVYKSPADFPDKYVIRIWETLPVPKASHYMSVVKNYEDCITELSSAGFLIKMARDKTDDPCILETWLR